jgi:hypothetical protein
MRLWPSTPHPWSKHHRDDHNYGTYRYSSLLSLWAHRIWWGTAANHGERCACAWMRWHGGTSCNFLIPSILMTFFLQFIYSQPPYSHIQTLHHQAHFKICQAISNKVPPATRPPNTSRVVSELWDVFESCWNLEPEDRPAAEVMCEYLRERAEEIANSLA